MGPPRVSFLPPSPVEPLLSGAALGAAPPPKDAPGCFGAEELELLGTGNGAELEQVDHGVCGCPAHPRAWLSPGMWHSPSASVCTRRGQGRGSFTEGWPRPRRAAGAGWVRCQCPRAGGAEVAPAISPSLCANWEGTSGDAGHAAWERGVQHGGECRCHREGVSEPSRAPAWGWTEHADTKDAPTHAGSHRETSLEHRATSPRHPGKGRLAGMGRTPRAARGGEGTGFSLQTEASIPKQIPLVYCKCCGKATVPRGCGWSNPTVGRLPRGLHAGWGQGGGEMPGHPIWKARRRTWGW